MQCLTVCYLSQPYADPSFLLYVTLLVIVALFISLNSCLSSRAVPSPYPAYFFIFNVEMYFNEIQSQLQRPVADICLTGVHNMICLLTP